MTRVVENGQNGQSDGEWSEWPEWWRMVRMARVIENGQNDQSGGEWEGPEWWRMTNEEEPFIDVAWPNEAWSDITKEIFHQLNAGTENGNWKRHPGYLRTGERRLYSRNISEQGKGFEYAVFINKREQRATCVCQFGPYLEGPPSPVPLGSTAIFHAKVDRQEDRKGYLSAYVTSADGRTTLCDATSLFVKLSQEQMEKTKKYLPQDSHSDKVVKAEKSVV
uniref:Uncharacterized protein n=1 Tax=Branchiostoma floridae TaxID=7739 RepID=C3ZN77_BRAFL|eukprot:XP_002590029.1 hypothetical protein BRAFLDRAFT_81647 [Branchiostoma floridae]